MAFPAMEEFTCTAETPWDGKPCPIVRCVVHPDAEEVGEQKDGWPGGDIITLKCPHCGHSWEKELPQ